MPNSSGVEREVEKVKRKRKENRVQGVVIMHPECPRVPWRMNLFLHRIVETSAFPNLGGQGYDTWIRSRFPSYSRDRAVLQKTPSATVTLSVLGLIPLFAPLLDVYIGQLVQWWTNLLHLLH